MSDWQREVNRLSQIATPARYRKPMKTSSKLALRRLIFLVMLTIWILPSAMAQRLIKASVGKTISKSLIYKAKNLKSEIICVIPKNTNLAIIGEDSKFYYICMISENPGYIKKSDIKIIKHYANDKGISGRTK